MRLFQQLPQRGSKRHSSTRDKKNVENGENADNAEGQDESLDHNLDIKLVNLDKKV